MSEYQYYNFVSLDRALTPKERDEVSGLSSRAEVNSHGASFQYNYGDFKHKPESVLLKYFDLMFYWANWDQFG